MSATTESDTQLEPETEQNTGTIVEVQGVVIEAVFSDKLPESNHSLAGPR